jgi:homoserine O-acetyltransferase
MHYYVYQHPIELESGASLPELQIAYHTFGQLNAQADNVVWVSHALTANSDVFDWWPGLFGPTDFFNPEEYFIVCPNILGSHYGTTGPLSIHPETGQPYLHAFPQFTVRDMVQVHQILADHLGIRQIQVLIGASLGGQQALEWSIQQPEQIKNLILLATNAQHSPWGIAFNESQRMAIELDPSWGTGELSDGMEGMKVARSIALLSYRHYQTYQQAQEESDRDKTDGYRAASYQVYQGEKLQRRFNAYSYYYLSKAMDSHHIGRGRGSVELALKQIQARSLIVGIDSDILFPPTEQKRLAEGIPDAQYVELNSQFGHDGFLLEAAALSGIFNDFFNTQTQLTKKVSLVSEH